MSINLLACLHCKSDAELAFESELKKLVTASVDEPGCLAYELYQYKDEPYKYVIEEEWTDEDALGAHMETPHYKNFVRVSNALLRTAADVKILTRLI
ncbi:antibiotic biosynthesis monooxygenase [Mucilaginibacter terrenus]|uniref:Antibiotic biosynthesis monooxygenase n=1 Tax=Mucilaginibacter terrenus TaxID=2482727 RepID=A0A3E2NXY0_9SPHI|nr:putative quinol monooxygenase [Mucilaginibacter terrenus]RFZ85853.1 antibiotic biosynthesis monooxygenase [Mucilaginibacter terrenus]